MRLRRTMVSMILLLAPALASGEPRSPNCGPAGLPADVARSIIAGFPGWRIKRQEEFDPYEQTLWTKSKGSECPGIAAGHFVHSKATDFAVLLVPGIPDRRGYKVVVFAKPNGTPAVTPTVIEDDKDESSARVVIYRVPPGRYEEPENTRRVRIRRDGIVVEAMEAGASLYFWRGGRFEQLIISE